MRRYTRQNLRRRLFVYFGAAILLSGLSTLLVMHLVGGWGKSWRQQIARMEAFVEGELEARWQSASLRDDFAFALSHHFDLDLLLTDKDGKVLTRFGEACHRPDFSIPVAHGSEALGWAYICARKHKVPVRPGVLVLTLCAVGTVLWGLAGQVARHISRPLSELTRVAEEIGQGQLSSRVRLPRFVPGEFGILAETLNRMAARVEQQIVDQRELLAAVSHEIRTPLARIRLLVEMARNAGTQEHLLDEIDQEVVEIDALVGKLLTQSRLDFGALTLRPLDAEATALRALERAGVSPSVLKVRSFGLSFEGDPTLIARAFANLIENAHRYGGGLTALTIAAEGEHVTFSFEDDGPGFVSGEEELVFDPFFQSTADAGRDGLGLGLALVRRIVEVHGGSAFAENRPEGGARVRLAFLRKVS